MAHKALPAVMELPQAQIEAAPLPPVAAGTPSKAPPTTTAVQPTGKGATSQSRIGTFTEDAAGAAGSVPTAVEGAPDCVYNGAISVGTQNSNSATARDKSDEATFEGTTGKVDNRSDTSGLHSSLDEPKSAQCSDTDGATAGEASSNPHGATPTDEEERASETMGL